MGAKIEFCYLSNDNIKSILVNLISVMFQSGVRYNENIEGEYTYWIDSPIWNFGDSNTVSEKSGNSFKTLNDMNDIINLLSSNYSPTLTFGTKLFERDIALILSICEGEGRWKEVKISLDRYEAYDSLNEIKKKKILIFLNELFYKIASSLKPYYGICATEIMGLATSPERVFIEKDTLGDFNYFSSELVSKTSLKVYENDYKIQELEDGGVILLKQHGLFNLGY
jgi:hypothetical protein